MRPSDPQATPAAALSHRVPQPSPALLSGTGRSHGHEPAQRGAQRQSEHRRVFMAPPVQQTDAEGCPQVLGGRNMGRDPFLRAGSQEAGRGAAAQRRARLWGRQQQAVLSEPQCGWSPRSGALPIPFLWRGIPRTPQSAPWPASACDGRLCWLLLYPEHFAVHTGAQLDRRLGAGGRSVEPSPTGGGDRPGEDSAPSQEGDHVIGKL